MFIVVDGYNFIGAVKRLNPGLENLRESLVSEIEEYAALSGRSVIVVFDGGEEGETYTSKNARKGVKVVFSPPGVEADDVIIEICRKYSGCLAVTNDSYIRKAIESYNSFAVSCEEFAETMRKASQETGGESDSRHATRDPDEDDSPPSKKGNPRRLSKKERKRRKLLDKL
ncbi:MAG: NYN domain-containing protein [Deltaproteobacteria bacterium]|nr:NYN domain-containing protein [Deltaproteobacteria bacterium]